MENMSCAPVHDPPYNEREIAYMITPFRVSELNEIIVAGNLPRYGKKAELLNRIIDSVKVGTASKQVHLAVRTVYMRRGGRTLPVSYSINQPPAANGNTNMPRQGTRDQTYASNVMQAQQQQNVRNYYAQQQQRATVISAGSGSTASTSYGGSRALNQQSITRYANNQPQAPGTAQSQSTSVSSGGGSNHSYSGRHLSSVKMSVLPFFDPLANLLEPTMFMTRNGGKIQENWYEFILPPNYINSLNYDVEKQTLPRTEIQFRCFMLDPSCEQCDDFPPSFALKCNEKNVTLPGVIPTNKPGAEQKRWSRPIDLTVYCQPIRSGNQKQRLQMQWHADHRNWFFVVRLVRRVSSGILLRRLLSKEPRSSEHIRDQIVERLHMDADDDLATDSLRVSLQCPLGMVRLKMPGKGIKCKHVQCFDVDLFLQMNEKRPAWKCPLCPPSDKHLPYEELLIEKYFVDVLECLHAEKQQTRDIELLSDGSWKAVKEDDDDGDTPPPPTRPAASSTAAANKPKQEQAPSQAKSTAAAAADDDEIQVIDLSDDEDDVPVPPPKQTPALAGRASSVTRSSAAAAAPSPIRRVTPQPSATAANNHRPSPKPITNNNKQSQPRPIDDDSIIILDSPEDDRNGGGRGSSSTHSSGQKRYLDDASSEQSTKRNRPGGAVGATANVQTGAPLSLPQLHASPSARSAANTTVVSDALLRANKVTIGGASAQTSTGGMAVGTGSAPKTQNDMAARQLIARALGQFQMTSSTSAPQTYSTSVATPTYAQTNGHTSASAAHNQQQVQTEQFWAQANDLVRQQQNQLHNTNNAYGYWMQDLGMNEPILSGAHDFSNLPQQAQQQQVYGSVGRRLGGQQGQLSAMDQQVAQAQHLYGGGVSAAGNMHQAQSTAGAYTVPWPQQATQAQAQQQAQLSTNDWNEGINRNMQDILRRCNMPESALHKTNR